MLVIAGIIISVPISIFHGEKGNWKYRFPHILYGFMGYFVGGIVMLALFLRLANALITAELSWLFAIPTTLMIAFVCFVIGNGLHKMLLRAKIL
jgi:hypothetical protein